MKIGTVSSATLASRIKALRNRHHELNSRIGREQTRPLPDNHSLRRLKKQRLGIRDAIRTMSSRLRHNGELPPSAA